MRKEAEAALAYLIETDQLQDFVSVMITRKARLEILAWQIFYIIPLVDDQCFVAVVEPADILEPGQPFLTGSRRRRRYVKVRRCRVTYSLLRKNPPKIISGRRRGICKA